LICNPLKLATPFDAATDVVPAAKLPEDNATEIVSVDPVFPVVMVFPRLSSIVTVIETVPPAVIELAGWVVMTSLFSAPGLTVKALEFTALVTPEMDAGVAVNVYDPGVLTTRLLKVATPFTTFALVVPEVNVACGPDAIDMVTEPELSEVSTFPYVSSTETATLGMLLPAVPGPGAAGVKASLFEAAGFTTRVKLPALLVPYGLVAVTVKG
jgi:hypothetical protein